ncbi:membrane protein [Xenorhabdus sp. KK7.4]|nr:membrane protein [Xenorhabdus sp. KK7.4]
MKIKLLCISAITASSMIISGCQSNADSYAADVYDTTQLNGKQETKTINIISVLPAKIAVENKANKEAAQTFGAILGAVAGSVVGYNAGSGSGAGTAAGAVGGGALGAAAGSVVKDKVIVEGVSLTYKEKTKIYTSTQVGRTCQFTPGLALVITTKTNETRIQPNAACPDKK